MARLLSTESDQNYALDQDVITIGRGPQNDIVLYDSTVSLNHCRLSKMPDGYYLEDLGSKNGVWINDRMVRAHRLNDAEELLIGRSRLQFDAEDQDEAAQKPQAYFRFVSGVRLNEVFVIPETGLRLGEDGKQTVLIFAYLEHYFIRCEFNHPSLPQPTLNNTAISNRAMRLQNGDQLSLLAVQLQFCCTPDLGLEYPSAEVAVASIADNADDHSVRDVAL